MMSKATKQILNHGRAKTAEAQPVRGASPDVGVPGTLKRVQNWPTGAKLRSDSLHRERCQS
jgi:hypothetical protein